MSCGGCENNHSKQIENSEETNLMKFTERCSKTEDDERDFIALATNMMLQKADMRNV
jgi:hypothetical protein